MFATYLIVRVVQILLWALMAAMFLRAILSWFVTEENGFLGFLYAMTEPIVNPVRLLLEKLNLFQESPLDVAFFITYLLLGLLSAVL